MSHRYIAELDGLRAVAALVVVAFHTRVPGFQGGLMGVDVFFVLSGYLTGSMALSGRYGFRQFMLRRLRRLWPLLLFVCGFFIALWSLAGVTIPAEVFFRPFFLGNFSMMVANPSSLLVHTWTLGAGRRNAVLCLCGASGHLRTGAIPGRMRRPVRGGDGQQVPSRADGGLEPGRGGSKGADCTLVRDHGLNHFSAASDDR